MPNMLVTKTFVLYFHNQNTQLLSSSQGLFVSDLQDGLNRKAGGQGLTFPLVSRLPLQRAGNSARAVEETI